MLNHNWNNKGGGARRDKMNHFDHFPPSPSPPTLPQSPLNPKFPYHIGELLLNSSRWGIN